LKKRGLEMRLRAKFGLILVGVLTLIWIKPSPTGTPEMPKDLVIKQRHATWDEKKENKRIAKLYAYSGWGWRGREWLCLHDLWSGESRFDHLAKNQQGSSAFGIAQLLGETDRRPRVFMAEFRTLKECRKWVAQQLEEGIA